MLPISVRDVSGSNPEGSVSLYSTHLFLLCIVVGRRGVLMFLTSAGVVPIGEPPLLPMIIFFPPRTPFFLSFSVCFPSVWKKGMFLSFRPWSGSASPVVFSSVVIGKMVVVHRGLLCLAIRLEGGKLRNVLVWLYLGGCMYVGVVTRRHGCTFIRYGMEVTSWVLAEVLEPVSRCQSPAK
jgi:hypothetical protein